MLEYYEKLQNLSSPESHVTMGIVIYLKDLIDGDILEEVVNELQVRFPYFYVKKAYKNDELITVPNNLPMTIRNSWNPINFNSKDSNYHLATWKYENNRLAFEISHSLTDGVGILPYIKSVLYLYLSKKTGQTFDSTGFRLPGDNIPESEIGNPFKGLDIDSIKAPFYKKKPISNFFQFTKEKYDNKRVFYLKLPEEQVMQYCKNKYGSPNALFSVLLAKATRQYDPENVKTITIYVAINHKSILGNHDNYRPFVGNALLDFSKNRNLDDLTKACTIARGQLMLQTQEENSLWEIKQMKQMMPAPSPDIPQASIYVSYPNYRSFEPIDSYIDGIYTVSSLSKITSILCEINCINHNFCIAFMQPFSSTKYFECFLKELDMIGIQHDLVYDEPLRLCGLE